MKLGFRNIDPANLISLNYINMATDEVGRDEVTECYEADALQAMSNDDFTGASISIYYMFTENGRGDDYQQFVTDYNHNEIKNTHAIH